MSTDPTAAARDILPLAKAVFGTVRGEGFAELPPEAITFFMYAAMAGVSHFLAIDMALPSHMREAAYELAPEIARPLRADVEAPGRPTGNYEARVGPPPTGNRPRAG